ncbi:DNA polymerase delta subunit 3 [Nymphon striatum]|nr:DNA polymerase delta subunit 3 [Nymphon striatum]
MSQIQPFKFEPEYATDEEREESLSSSQSSSKDDEKASRIGEQSWCESQMLHHYVSNQKEIGKNDLRITYFISGWQSVNSLKRLKSFVVKEDNLEKVKSLFDQISSLHIYSIQRCKLLDYNALIIADYNKLKETKFSNSYSAISNPDAKFSSENSRILKTVSAPVASKNSTVPKEDFKTSSKPKSKGIAAMFNKNPSSTVSTSDKKVESKGKNVSVKSGKGIVGMLAKQAEKSNNSDKSKVDKENTSFNKSEKVNGNPSKSPDMSERTDENISVSKKKIDSSSKEKSIIVGKTKQSVSLRHLLPVADNQNDSLTAILPIINIMLTISPSTAQCERGFSAMNGLKTQYRTSLNQNSLSHLMRVKVDGPSVKDFNPTDSLVTWINSGKSTKHLKGHKLSGKRNPRPGPAVLADTSSSDGSVENSDTE